MRRDPTLAPERVTLVSGRYLAGKGLYVLRLADVTTREQAEALRDTTLLVLAGDRPPLAPNEFHVGDLLGLEVRLQHNANRIGTVVDVFSAGNDLLAIALDPSFVQAKPGSKSSAKPQPALIPLVPEIVPVVDLAEGYVEITPPTGLLELSVGSMD